MTGKSITLVKDKKKLLPIIADDKVFVLSPVRSMISGVDGSLTSCDFAKMFADKFACDYKSFDDVANLSDDEIDNLLCRCKNADKVVVGLYNATIQINQQQLLQKIVEVNRNIITVALRIPYDAELLYCDVSTAICLYDYTNEVANILINAMLENFNFTGKLPVALDLV